MAIESRAPRLEFFSELFGKARDCLRTGVKWRRKERGVERGRGRGGGSRREKL